MEDADAQAVMKDVLETIAKLFQTKAIVRGSGTDPGEDILPRVDHPRIRYSCDFWDKKPYTPSWMRNFCANMLGAYI
ncbi:unnamed protein product [Amoebophrya sp. A25]|nr:unnamed protein product [Amoebophrya sp. A25]|eukprot:GSA25T00012432001.1